MSLPAIREGARFICSVKGMGEGVELTLDTPGILTLECRECQGRVTLGTGSEQPGKVTLQHGAQCLTGFRVNALWN